MRHALRMRVVNPSDETVVDLAIWGPDEGLPENDIFSAIESHSDDSLTHLLSTAAMAVTFDRPLTQRCVQRAAILLGLGASTALDPSDGLLSSRGGLAFWRVKRVKTYVEDNVGSTIRVARLAELLGLSTSHFHHAFRKTFGMSPISYVMRQRMRRAQQLMLKPNSSLSEIALECGMCDQAHFSRAFRRIVKTSPSAWRRQHVNLIRRRPGEQQHSLQRAFTDEGLDTLSAKMARSNSSTELK